MSSRANFKKLDHVKFQPAKTGNRTLTWKNGCLLWYIDALWVKLNIGCGINSVQFSCKRNMRLNRSIIQA